jgi:gliding motility-associated-like protein
MCVKLTGNENGLIGYWTFDEPSGNTVLDKSSNHYNGALKGNPQRLYSGAPIGDKSVNLYPSNWSGNTLILNDGNYNIKISSVTSGTPGAHIYEVLNIPSQTSGLDMTQITQPYFGVFSATVNSASTFNLSYEISGAASCELYSRADNSIPNWNVLSNNDIQNRIEIIGYSPPPAFQLELGEDKILCDQTSVKIDSDVDPTGKLFKWSTGESTPSIIITSSGSYYLEIIEDCVKVSDTITLTFLPTPTTSDFFGEDQILCFMEPKEIKPSIDLKDFIITWQDGSNNDSYNITDFGMYWARIENFCGSMTDTVEYSKRLVKFEDVPNVITPNNDAFNQNFQVENGFLGSYLSIFNRWGKEVYRNENYQNDWDGNGVDSGVYFFLMRDQCLNEFKGTITVVK